MNEIINRLYPPHIEGGVPAALYDTETSEGATITIVVPVVLGPGLVLSNITKFILSIKSAVSNKFLGTVKTLDNTINEDGCVVFQLDNSTVEALGLIKNNYYKIQIACVEKSTTSSSSGKVGYFSQSSLIKIISKPKITLLGLSADPATATQIYSLTSLTGCFDPLDSGEFLYSSRFQIFDYAHKLVIDSNELLHDSSQIDELGHFLQEFIFRYTFDLNRIYTIRFSVITNSLFEMSQEFYIKRIVAPAMTDNIRLLAKNQYEEGYIELQLVNDSPKQSLTGKYIVSRACNDTNFKSWEPIGSFDLIKATLTNTLLYKDLYVEYGKQYLYSIQKQLDDYHYTSSKTSNLTTSFFEHAFLIGENGKQLKLKYNPKISINRVSSTSKLETLGSKYPFVFKNGYKDYREFTIDTLLSYLSDDAELFYSHNIENNSINLVDENFKKEIDFKEKAITWLNNSKTKILKTPDNANALIQVMGLTITPNDGLSRMLNTINIKAIEINDYTYDNLIMENLLSKNNNLPIQILNKTTTEIGQFALNTGIFDPSTNLINGETTIIKNLTYFSADYVPIDTIFTIQYFGEHYSEDMSVLEEHIFKIESDMLFRIDNNFRPGLYKIIWNSPKNVSQGTITIKADSLNILSKIETQSQSTEETTPVIFVEDKVIRMKEYTNMTPDINLLQLMTNIYRPQEETEKHNCQIGYFSFLQLEKSHPITGIAPSEISKPGFYYWNNRYYSKKGTEPPVEVIGYNPYDCFLNCSVSDGIAPINIEDSGEFYITDLEQITQLSIGPGIKLNCGYCLMWEEGGAQNGK